MPSSDPVIQLEGVAVTESDALAIFAGDDEDAARRAYEWLSQRSRPVLNRLLVKNGFSDARYRELREDAVQHALVKTWAYHGRFDNRGVAAWYKYLQTAATNYLLDCLKKRSPETPC